MFEVKEEPRTLSNHFYLVQMHLEEFGEEKKKEQF